MPKEGLTPQQNLTTKEGVIAYLRSDEYKSKKAAGMDWRETYKEVKKANHDTNPSFWKEIVDLYESTIKWEGLPKR